MNTQTLTHLWGMRLTFALVVCIVLFFHLLPVATASRLWVGPDMLIAFACAWSLRRPEYVPSVALAGLFLLADLLLQRPPGLWAMLALLSCEHLKVRSRALRDVSFASEWLTVCIIFAVVAVAYRLGLLITLLEPPALAPSIVQLVMTMLCYPLAVAVTHWFLGVRKTAPGDYDTGGGTS